jgi:hypothetical protein
VIIHAYNQHVRLLSPEPLVVDKPQSTRVSGAGVVMQSSEFRKNGLSGNATYHELSPNKCREQGLVYHHLTQFETSSPPRRFQFPARTTGSSDRRSSADLP